MRDADAEVSHVSTKLELPGFEKEDENECHFSPYCSREGEEYVTVHIDGKPFSVWVCGRCR